MTEPLFRAPFVLDEGELSQRPEDELWVTDAAGVRTVAEEVVQRLSTLPYLDVACIGAATVNQAVKAVAVARETLSHSGYDLQAQPYFSTFRSAQGKRTRMVIRVTKVRVA